MTDKKFNDVFRNKLSAFKASTISTDSGVDYDVVFDWLEGADVPTDLLIKMANPFLKKM